MSITIDTTVRMEKKDGGVCLYVMDNASKTEVIRVTMSSETLLSMLMGGRHDEGLSKSVLGDTRFAGHKLVTKTMEVFVPAPSDPKNEDLKKNLATEALARVSVEGWMPHQSTNVWKHDVWTRADIVAGEKGHWCRVEFLRYIPPVPSWEDLQKLGVRYDQGNPEKPGGYNIFHGLSFLSNTGRWNDGNESSYSFVGDVTNKDFDLKVRTAVAKALTQLSR